MADAGSRRRRGGEGGGARAAKKRARNPEEWHKQKQKRLRIAGKEHINTNGKTVPEKQPGPDCKCRRKCYSKVPETVRLQTFRGFYSMKSHDEQNAYLFGLMRQIDIKRKRKKDSSRRTCTFEYYIRVRGRETQVCQQAFKNIHSITERKVRVLCKKMDDGIMFPSDNRGKSSGRLGEVRLPQDVINQIKTHIYTIVHTHRLKDFIRIDKATGLEINITKMWKDYIKLYDPAYIFTILPKNKKSPTSDEQQVPQLPVIQSTYSLTQEIPTNSSSTSETYCLTYPNTSIMNIAENYITQTMVPAQYSSQPIGVGSYVQTDKMSYYPQGQVVVQPGGMQQLMQTSDPNHPQQQYAQPHSETNTYLIVRAVPAPIKTEQVVEIKKMKDEKPKLLKKDKKRGPAVKQWRYTSIFHEEINGVALAAIKTRLPLYYSEITPKKKSKINGVKPQVEQEMQPQQCIPQQHCQPQQCQQQQCQQVQQQPQPQSLLVPSSVQTIQTMHHG